MMNNDGDEKKPLCDEDDDWENENLGEDVAAHSISSSSTEDV